MVKVVYKKWTGRDIALRRHPRRRAAGRERRSLRSEGLKLVSSEGRLVG